MQSRNSPQASAGGFDPDLESPHFSAFQGDGPGLIPRAPSPDEPDFARLLALITGRPFLEGNAIDLLHNGNEFFPAMIELIASAQRSITFETYIWQSGEISDAFLDALAERAQKGVKVHVMVDGFGAIKLKRSDINRVREAGVRFVFYERARAWRTKFNINRRNHRKILIVDGRTGITGGIGISDEWHGDGTSPTRWRDNGYRIRGPIVNQMQAVFVNQWLGTTAQLLWGEDYFPRLKPAGSIPARFDGSQPRTRYTKTQRTFLLAIASARKSIRIGHSYFVPDDEAIALLIDARERGVDVEILLAKRSDSSLVRAVTRSRLPRLLEKGIKIFFFEPALFHCKYLIVDDAFVCAGSSNFDPRSFRMHTEADFSALDPEFASRHLESCEADKAQASPWSLQNHRRRPVHVKLLDAFMGCFWRLF